MIRPSRLLGLVVFLLLSSCARQDAGIHTLPLEPDFAPAVLVVTPQSSFLGWIGEKASLTARVGRADGTSVPSLKVRWRSLDEAVVRVDSTGLLTAAAEGSGRVLATVVNLADTVNVTVRRVPAVLTVWPDTVLFLELGAEMRISSRVVDGGGQELSDSVVTWTSSDTTIITVSGQGTITARGEGRTTIAARSGPASASVVVRVAVGPESITVAPGMAAFTALEDTLRIVPTVRDAAGGVMEDYPVTFSLSDTGVATTDTTGLLTSRRVGSTILSLRAESVVKSLAVTVRQVPASVVVSPDSVTLTPGGVASFDAVASDRTGHPIPNASVVWTSSDTAVVRVASDGTATARSPGSATVTATAGTASASATVTVLDVPVSSVDVSPASAMLVVGQTQAFTARFYAAGGLELVGPTATWSSTDTLVASVSQAGVATARSVGSAWIRAVADEAEGASDSALVTVSAPPSAFDIEVRFLGALPTPAQEALYQAAAARWSEILVGDLADIPLTLAANACGITHPALAETIDDLVIFAMFDSIDGPGEILGGGGPCLVRTSGGLPLLSIIRFDEADVPAMEAGGTLYSTILHEMGHALGFGASTPWEDVLVDSGLEDPYWPGVTAVAEYGKAGGTALRRVPVANTGGSGTRDAHWRESHMGSELMTGYLGPSLTEPLSAITAGAFQDMGYVVALGAADAYAVSAALRAPGAQPPVRLEEVVIEARWGVTPEGRLVPVR